MIGHAAPENKTKLMQKRKNHQCLNTNFQIIHKIFDWKNKIKYCILLIERFSLACVPSTQYRVLI